MNEKYERLCEEVRWGKDSKSQDIKRKLMKTWSREDLIEVEQYISQLKHQLNKVGLEDLLAEENGYYGDAVHDCMCELVAHGEQYVQQVIADPQIAVSRFKNNDYTENFMYIFPYEEDYETLNLQYHKDRAAVGMLYIDQGKFDSIYKYTQQYMDDTGGYDFTLAYEVMSEISHGIANLKRDYNDIYQRTLNIGHHAYFANVWGDFVGIASEIAGVEIIK